MPDDHHQGDDHHKANHYNFAADHDNNCVRIAPAPDGRPHTRVNNRPGDHGVAANDASAGDHICAGDPCFAADYGGTCHYCHTRHYCSTCDNASTCDYGSTCDYCSTGNQSPTSAEERTRDEAPAGDDNRARDDDLACHDGFAGYYDRLGDPANGGGAGGYDRAKPDVIPASYDIGGHAHDARRGCDAPPGEARQPAGKAR